MNMVSVAIYTIWFFTEILFNRLLHSKSADKKNADKSSLNYIWITIIATIFLAVYISINFLFPIYLNPDFRYVGIAIIFIGIIFRLIAIISLGRFFTVDVTIRPDHKLKKDGLYKYVRHPSYSASLISFIGFGISQNNWVSLLIITIAIFTVFIIRINIEEKVLTEQFDAEYIAYKKVTKRLIPFIY